MILTASYIYEYSHSNLKNNVIYLYAGPGAFENSVAQAESTLTFLASPSYKIKKIGPKEVIEGKWATDAALIVMPGGADIPYGKHLSPQGNLNIKEFVKNGGAYLGLCGGAYYGAKEILFAVGTPMEVTGKRELSFYQGIAEGPVLAPFVYDSHSSARLASLRWIAAENPLSENRLFASFFNGGCHFVNAEAVKNATPLAKYIEENSNEEKTAIVEIKVGKGTVILSGVHFEYSPALLDQNDQYLKPISQTLKENDEGRIKIARYLLQRLGINKI
jgi:biotin--protein ligase